MSATVWTVLPIPCAADPWLVRTCVTPDLDWLSVIFESLWYPIALFCPWCLFISTFVYGVFLLRSDVFTLTSPKEVFLRISTWTWFNECELSLYEDFDCPSSFTTEVFFVVTTLSLELAPVNKALSLRRLLPSSTLAPIYLPCLSNELASASDICLWTQ